MTSFANRALLSVLATLALSGGASAYAAGAVRSSAVTGDLTTTTIKVEFVAKETAAATQGHSSYAYLQEVSTRGIRMAVVDGVTADHATSIDDGLPSPFELTLTGSQSVTYSALKEEPSFSGCTTRSDGKTKCDMTTTQYGTTATAGIEPTSSGVVLHLQLENRSLVSDKTLVIPGYGPGHIPDTATHSISDDVSLKPGVPVLLPFTAKEDVRFTLVDKHAVTDATAPKPTLRPIGPDEGEGLQAQNPAWRHESF